MTEYNEWREERARVARGERSLGEVLYVGVMFVFWLCGLAAIVVGVVALFSR